jgi:GR25 family glycosyltransferase involved in LPS biosynthesis
MSINTHIISLKRVSERREYVEDYIQKNPSCSIFEAIDKLDEERIIPLIKKHEMDIEPKYASCILSHLSIINNFLDSDKKYQIIMEDDFKVKKQLPKSVDDVEKMIKEIGVHKQYVDILYISDRVDINDKYEIIGGCGTEGYILSRKGAMKLKYILNKGVKHPVDLQFQAHYKYCDYIRDLINVRVKFVIVNAYRSKDIYVTCRGLESTINN